VGTVSTARYSIADTACPGYGSQKSFLEVRHHWLRGSQKRGIYGKVEKASCHESGARGRHYLFQMQAFPKIEISRVKRFNSEKRINKR
jgi:hypothetical protein